YVPASLFSSLLVPPPPTSTLFPYTTLFRSLLPLMITAPAEGLAVRWTVICTEPEPPAGTVPTVQATTPFDRAPPEVADTKLVSGDRKSTRLNSSHVSISYAVFCLKKKKTLT